MDIWVALRVEIAQRLVAALHTFGVPDPQIDPAWFVDPDSILASAITPKPDGSVLTSVSSVQLSALGERTAAPIYCAHAINEASSPFTIVVR